jgi:mono/diheme cytochrome c family protein
MIFLLIYFVKTILLLINSEGALDKFKQKTKVLEMIVSFAFLLSGIYLWANSGDLGLWFYVKVAAVVISIPLAIIGYKKGKKMLAVIAFFLIVYAYGVAETKSIFFSKQTGAPIDLAATDAQYIYSQQCVKCHGEDGKLGLSGAKDLSVSTLGLEERVAVIGQGKGAMVGFDNQLSKEQVAAVAEYVETLKK